MKATILPKAIIPTKACRAAVIIMAKGRYCCLSTASKVFLILLYSYLCSCNAIFSYIGSGVTVNKATDHRSNILMSTALRILADLSRSFPGDLTS